VSGEHETMNCVYCREYDHVGELVFGQEGASQTYDCDASS